jgi:hypothetical protein
MIATNGSEAQPFHMKFSAEFGIFADVAGKKLTDQYFMLSSEFK